LGFVRHLRNPACGGLTDCHVYSGNSRDAYRPNAGVANGIAKIGKIDEHWLVEDWSKATMADHEANLEREL
jgi:hypothetical protein